MQAANVFNNNSGRQNFAGSPAAITTTGQYCAIVATYPNLIWSASYLVVAGAGVTAVTIGIQLLQAYEVSGTQTWVTATTPNSSTGAALTLINGTAPGTYNGSFTLSNGLFVPINGIRLNVTTLTGGNITLAQLVGQIG